MINLLLSFLIAFVGDSYTQGGGDEIPENGYGFAEQVARELDADFIRHVGYTFPATNWDEIEAAQPDMIVVELGIHVILGRDKSDMGPAIKEAMTRAKGITDNVIYVEIPWRTWGDAKNQQAKEANIIIYSEAAAQGVRVARVYDALEACGWDCVGSDGVHPNDRGHWIITEAVLNAEKADVVFLPIVVKE